MKKQDKKFEYRDRSLAKLDKDFEQQREWNLTKIAEAFKVPAEYLNLDERPSGIVGVSFDDKSILDVPKEPKWKSLAPDSQAAVTYTFKPVVKQEITMELSEDAIAPLEPFFAKAFADAFEGMSKGAESAAESMKKFGDTLREGVQEAVAEGLFEALTFDDIKNAMLDVDRNVANTGTFLMSGETYDKLKKEFARADERRSEEEEELRERQEEIDRILRSTEEIERARNLDLLKVKQKLIELRKRPDDDDDVFFEQGTRAMRVRERIGGVAVPASAAESVKRIIGERSIARQLSRTIPMVSKVEIGGVEVDPRSVKIDFSEQEFLETSPVPLPADPDALAIVGEEGPEFVDVSLRWEPVKIEIPKGAILEVDEKLYANPPAGWERVEGFRALKKST